MCLAIPGQVLTIDSTSEPWNRTGRVLFGTIEKSINLA
jgi:hydrogenase maturation factor